MSGRKIFVGSLPDGIDAETLQLEFSKFGVVEDVYVKPNCQSGRQWAFITFQEPSQAQLAKTSCDRNLTFPGAARPCDVMFAKNQGMFGQDPIAGGGPPPAQAPSYGHQAQSMYDPAVQDMSSEAPKKIFVGSLPDGMTEGPLRAEFSKFGNIEEVYLKPGCESGRQWAFVHFETPEQAEMACNASHNVLMFQGSMKPCEVTLARNQGMFGQGSLTGQPPQVQQAHRGLAHGSGASHYQEYQAVSANAPRKIFVGSLPDDIDDSMLMSEFCKYGEVTEIYIKPGCESGRQWAFVHFASPDQAQYAKDCCDRILTFPGAVKPCEVTIARNQGMFGQDPVTAQQAPNSHAAYQPQVQQIMAEGPKKIFVGSLPDDISDAQLRAEFSKYGQVTDVYLKAGCEPGRQWAFVTFNSPEQAQYAKDCTDRVLMFPGSMAACEVMLAKNQGKFGQAPLQGGPPPAAVPPRAVIPPAASYGAQAAPPPPSTPPPASLTPWRMYKTVAGLPYYHNHVTNVTQWECPPELQGLPSTTGAGVRSSPY